MAVAAWDLVGRAEELALLDSAAGDGSGSIVVAGAVGVGKSRLVEEFLGHLKADRMRQVLVRATRSTATIPFGAFAAWAPEQTAVTGTDRLEVLRNTSRELLAGEDRLVVAVDDAHLLDEGSAALVLHLVGHAQVSVVVTVRSGEPCPDAVSALWKEGLAERVDLQSLSAPETVELVEGLLGGAVDPASQRRLWVLTQGTPLYVREVVRAGIDQEVLVEDGGVWRWRGELTGGGRLGELVVDQLGRASTDQRRALELLAFGEPLPIELLAQLGLMDTVAEAEQHGYVVTEERPDGLMVRLGHPLYGEVLRANVRPLTAREHCKRLAAAAEAVGWLDRDPLRVASWWLESGTTQGPPEVFLAAAARALGLVEWQLAKRLARAAEDSGAGVQASSARAAALWALERWDEVEELFADLSQRELDDESAADVALAHARYLFWLRGRSSAALDVITTAAEELQPPTRGHVLAYGGYLASFACDPAEAERLATAAIVGAGPAVAFRVEAMAAASLAWMSQGQTAAAIAAAEMAIPHVPVELGLDPNPTAVLPAAYALACVLDGRLDDAAGITETVMALADADEGAKMFRGLAHTLVGRIALCQGRMDVARRHGKEGLSILTEGGLLPGHWPAAVVATDAPQLGDTASAKEALDWVATSRTPVPLYALELNLARAWFAAAQGELSTARALADDVATEAAAVGAFAFELFALTDLARLGAPEAASARLDELAEIIAGAFAPAVAAFVRALTARHGNGLDDASARFEAMGAVLIAAEAAAAAAAQHRREGRRGSAIASLTRARQLVAQTGGACTPLLQGIDAEPALATLTDREREVVELAARGMTNRDIASHLYVSIRTVNTHLAHAYAKLGLNDRTQLAALLRPGQPR
jgi:DNA-binding NarL/FixJ family response regulator/type II secretory pathway predicted ATPase ExeA